MADLATQFAAGKTKKPRNIWRIARSRSREGAQIADRLLAIPNASPTVIAAAHMIRKAAQPQNIWTARNLCTEEGRPYEGTGALWVPGIRLCPSYQAAASRRARKRVREAVDRVPPLLGERRRLLTLTAPTVCGIGLARTLELFEDSWTRLRKSVWWLENVRAGVKGTEFTLGDPKRLIAEKREWSIGTDGYHVHFHVFLISKWIDWQELGQLWTSCFLRAAAERSIAITINTSHNRLIVDVREVTEKRRGHKAISLEAAIQEVCKYITKGRSWLDMLDSELCEAIVCLRGKRMIEAFGECRSDHTRKYVDPSNPGAADPTYLDTQDTSDGVKNTGGRGVLPLAKPERRPSIFKLGVDMITVGQLQEWLSQVLEPRVDGVQNCRREMLAECQPYASFSTLKNELWYGTLLKESMHAARACVNVFSSIGVDEFAVTMLHDMKASGKRGTLYERRNYDELRRSILRLVNRNWMHDESLIVRPVSCHLIQIDDCNKELLDWLKRFAFLAVETSSGNYQVWLALPIQTKKDERDLIRSRLFKVFEGIDKNASGAMRWPGSINHKPGRCGFCVRIVSTNLGRFVTTAELDAAGLLAPMATQEAPGWTLEPERSLGDRLQWPDYARCLREAPIRNHGLPDRSRADNRWCILALDRGWSETAVEAKLCELSDKARCRPGYARRTVAYAASVVAENNGLSSIFAGIIQQLSRGTHERAGA